MNAVEILYEDKDIFVVVKPAGMPSQPERSAAMDMVSYLKNLLAARDKIKNPYISVVHRLDRPVGGVMVYAKNKKSAAALSAQIAQRDVSKEYVAVVRGLFDLSKGTLEDMLIKDGRTNLSRAVTLEDKDIKDAKRAVLDYKVLETAQYGDLDYSLVKIRLHTGRHHQIRVQMANSGHPIAGDRKYTNAGVAALTPPKGGGMAFDPFRELGLFSARLEFIHPTGKKPVCWTAKPTAQPFLLFHNFCYEASRE